MENSKASAAQKGTAAHAFLQFCDFEKFKVLRSNGQDLTTAVIQETERLCQEGFIDRSSADMLDAQMLSRFFESDFFGIVALADSYQKELRFNRFVPLASLTRNPEIVKVVGDRTLYIQGSIDLVLHTDEGEIILCDYKSDRITDDERSNPELLVKKFSERHIAQLKQYSKAIFDLYGKHPAKIFIYSLPLGEAVEIDT
jgi:ATP-dependent helicase/nuclease subunit A